MKIFNPFYQPTHIDHARQQLPRAKLILLHAHAAREHAEAAIEQREKEIARLQATLDAHDAEVAAQQAAVERFSPPMPPRE